MFRPKSPIVRNAACLLACAGFLAGLAPGGSAEDGAMMTICTGDGTRLRVPFPFPDEEEDPGSPVSACHGAALAPDRRGGAPKPPG